MKIRTDARRKRTISLHLTKKHEEKRRQKTYAEIVEIKDRRYIYGITHGRHNQF